MTFLFAGEEDLDAESDAGEHLGMIDERTFATRRLFVALFTAKTGVRVT